MGYIDCDTHVYETDHTWDYLDPGERHLRPVTMVALDGSRKGQQSWIVGDQRSGRHDRTGHFRAVEATREAMAKNPDFQFPEGSVSLEDVPARLAKMDELGVDAQVLISTFFLTTEIVNPAAVAALARSWNRWIAERTADAGGRLPWSVKVPLGEIDQAVKEIEFGKEHGAVSVMLYRYEHLPYLSNPYYYPLYAKALELDMAIGVHKGGNSRTHQLQHGRETMWKVSGAVAEAFLTVAVSDLDKKFPGLRWAFLEAGTMWIPFVLQEIARSDETLGRNVGADWKQFTSLLEDKNLYVAAQIDDDLPYILPFAGQDRLVVGSDWGHTDRGSDPNALRIVASRPDVDAGVLQKITDDNGRRLYNIDRSVQLRPTASAEAQA